VTMLPSAGRDGHSAARLVCYDTAITDGNMSSQGFLQYCTTGNIDSSYDFSFAVVTQVKEQQKHKKPQVYAQTYWNRHLLNKSNVLHIYKE
jgi:hypothetical protein